MTTDSAGTQTESPTPGVSLGRTLVPLDGHIVTVTRVSSQTTKNTQKNDMEFKKSGSKFSFRYLQFLHFYQ